MPKPSTSGSFPAARLIVFELSGGDGGAARGDRMRGRIGFFFAIPHAKSLRSYAGIALDFAEPDVLRALPKHFPSQCGELVEPFRDGQEMVAGKLAHLAGKVDAAIGKQDFGFAEAAGIKDELSGRRVARGVFKSQAKIGIT